MPCRADYPKPNPLEKELRRVNQLLMYVLDASGEAVPKSISDAANNDYGDTATLDADTRKLCTLCKRFEKSGEADDIIYDGRNPEARKLADWWDQHKKFDEEQKQQAAVKRRNQKLKKQALAKLLPEEITALGLE
jgi:predicted HNH restriction endonuclease